MNKLVMSLSLVVIMALASTVYAVPKGRTLDFSGAAMGNVVFDGTVHNNAATKGCRECHNPQLFPKQKQGTVKITMKNIYAGEQCGFCHNGERAFRAQGNCTRCHKR
ncbi:MAG: cytochrome c3 family protein [Desulfuromonas sp.]|nr:cytochrome c3 family protein [Desulfuromonas sp.]